MKFTDDILKRQGRVMKALEWKRKSGRALAFFLEKREKQQSPKETEILKVKSSAGLAQLVKKELADHLTSRRFIIILILIYATSFASLYGALSGLEAAVENDSNFIFLKLYTTSGNSIPSFMSFIALLGPFVGLTLGFDAINSERSAGTLNRLVSQPIYRDSIIIGKFLAGVSVIGIMVFSMGIFIGAVGILVTGLMPDGEEVLRIMAFLIFTIIYMAFWLSLSIFFSVICRHSATSALAVIALWIFFTIFMSLIANIIAGAVYPINTQYNSIVNAYNNYSLELNFKPDFTLLSVQRSGEYDNESVGAFSECYYCGSTGRSYFRLPFVGAEPSACMASSDRDGSAYAYCLYWFLYWLYAPGNSFKLTGEGKDHGICCS